LSQRYLLFSPKFRRAPRLWLLVVASLITLAALTLLFPAACAQGGATPTLSPAPSSSKALAPPILTELQAIETAGQKAALSRIGLTGVSNIRNRQARLMTMGEYWALGHYDYGFFGSAEWYPESDLPVWVVLMEGNAESPLPTSSPLTPTLYNYFVVVLNAHTGYEIGFSPLSAPEQLLEEAQGLDPARYARYPLEAALVYTKDITDFPVSEPSSLPGGFSLAKVTLELAHPLQDVLPYPQERRQTVLQHYSDGQENTIQLAQFSGGLPDLIESADRTTVQETKAWASHEAGKSTWLAWTWVFPEAGAYVTYILYSAARSISLDTLHEIAASMPAGGPPPPTPEPVRVPTAEVLEPVPTANIPATEALDDPEVLIQSALDLALQGDSVGVYRLGLSGDLAYVPVLIDMLRFSRSFPAEEMQSTLFGALGEIAKQNFPENFREFETAEATSWSWWVKWLGRNPDIKAPPGYAAWKGRLYARLVDREMGAFLYSGIQTNIRLEEVVWGGVRKDGIPDLTNPPVIDAKEAVYLDADERVFGVSFNGEHRAYPHRILNAHEMANDVVGGVPFALAY